MMPATGADLKVDPTTENGVVVLTVDFAPEFLVPGDAYRRLSEEFIKKYEDTAATIKNGSSPSCIVDLQAKKAGSSLVRALFELYKSLEPRGAKLICVNYPKAYFNTLTATGLPKLKNFELASTKPEAFRRFFSSAPPAK